MWPCALVTAGLMAAEIHLGYDGLRAWVPYAVLLPLTVALLAWLGRVQVRIAGGELRVDDAHIPLELLITAEPLDAAAKRDALGLDLHPYAFVVHRPWIRGAVRIDLDDPADPTPYWVISSRRPAALVAALGLPLPEPDVDPDAAPPPNTGFAPPAAGAAPPGDPAASADPGSVPGG
jgi:hypothetical protein